MAILLFQQVSIYWRYGPETVIFLASDDPSNGAGSATSTAAARRTDAPSEARGLEQAFGEQRDIAAIWSVPKRSPFPFGIGADGILYTDGRAVGACGLGDKLNLATPTAQGVAFERRPSMAVGSALRLFARPFDMRGRRPPQVIGALSVGFSTASIWAATHSTPSSRMPPCQTIIPTGS